MTTSYHCDIFMVGMVLRNLENAKILEAEVGKEGRVKAIDL